MAIGYEQPEMVNATLRGAGIPVITGMNAINERLYRALFAPAGRNTSAELLAAINIAKDMLPNIQTDEEKLALWAQLALSASLMGHSDTAFKCIKHALAIDPYDIETLTVAKYLGHLSSENLSALPLNTLWQCAEKLIELRHFDDAITFIETALEKEPNDLEFQAFRTNTLISYADFLEQQSLRSESTKPLAQLVNALLDLHDALPREGYAQCALEVAYMLADKADLPEHRALLEECYAYAQMQELAPELHNRIA